MEKPSKHSRKFKHAPQIWPTQRQDPPCAGANDQAQQQNGKTWPSIRPRMARIERGRPPIGLHTMAKPSKRVHSAGRQNHKVDQKQSQTDHATADPSTHSRQRYRRTRPQPQTQSKKRFCLQKTMPTDGGRSDTRPNKSSKTDKNAALKEDRAAKSDQTAKIHAKIRLLLPQTQKTSPFQLNT